METIHKIFVFKIFQKNCAYLVSLSTPCCLYCISMLICSSSRFRRATLLRASATSDLSRSGSYFVLLTLEVVEFTEIRNLHTKYNVAFYFLFITFFVLPSPSLIWDQCTIVKALSHRAKAKAKSSFDVCRLFLDLFCFLKLSFMLSHLLSLAVYRPLNVAAFF